MHEEPKFGNILLAVARKKKSAWATARAVIVAMYYDGLAKILRMAFLNDFLPTGRTILIKVALIQGVCVAQR